jgi:hypothetical protein
VSLLPAMEYSVCAFERHRQWILDQLKGHPARGARIRADARSGHGGVQEELMGAKHG